MPEDSPGIDIELPHPPVTEDGEQEMPFPEYTELGNLQVALSGMAVGAAAGTTRRVDRSDQLSGDAQAMWSIAMTSPTVMAAHGMRLASEAGAGRTRIESNTPASSQIVGG